MARNAQDYLAASVLNDGAIVNYRMLSRALKIHSNAAKNILRDFYSSQTARKPGSLHATYLLTGIRKPVTTSQGNGSQEGQDSFMSDGFGSSSMPDQEDNQVEHIQVTSITLVAEEHLDVLKALYETITSEHVYSLEPGPLSNMQILSDCNRKVASEYSKEDPLETWKTYGTIHNPQTKRRTNRQPPPPVAPAAPITAGMRPAAAAKPPIKADTSRPPSREESEVPKTDNKKTVSAKPASIRRESSNLMKSFAKTKPPAAKQDGPPTDADAQMKDDSEGEDTPADDSQHTEENIAKAAAAKKEREEREANLRKMMEDDDEADGTDAEAQEDEEGDIAMAETPSEDNARTIEEEEQVEHALDKAPPPEAEQEQVTTSDGRRRGRRRVMKKKTTKDAEGYLVTREEPVWESFSEDEPEPKRQKPVVVPAAAKAKGPVAGGAVKKGQNIMNFFSKKG